ncbi:D-sedoheptulose-7-phosphate isomerase [Sulfuritortus calidifontis]|uniref:D-sedoheptulose-7-phosphate isomerase n=1 Tax=Sulfuritortus calidifontis TaxID=1914471 RepID=UPI001559FAD5|nr:D-sedoheptulose 7-phosphate isomerase [Sulfuritortus calidifontis]
MKQVILHAIDEHAAVLDDMRRMAERVAEAAVLLRTIISNGGVIYLCGNGGSAADAQHLAAELVGRFRRERRALSAIALTTDTSVLTCIGNDYSFADIFSRQVEGLVKAGDALLAISTSGNSENVIRAAEKAKAIGATTIGLLGRDGGRLASLCTLPLVVPATDTARIQEMHILIGHILCDLIEGAEF